MNDINTGEKLNKGYILRLLRSHLTRSKDKTRDFVADDLITKIERDRAYFITTIESQKKEIALKQIDLDAWKNVTKFREDQLTESRAIKELAVKGLKEVQIISKIDNSDFALAVWQLVKPLNSEIEKLQNG